jgi:hypothetical protein
MRTRLPGLLVLGIILLAGLAYLFFGSDWTTTDRVDPKSDGNAAAIDEQDGTAKEQRAETDADATKTDGAAREAILGGHHYSLRGEVLRRGETPSRRPAMSTLVICRRLP